MQNAQAKQTPRILLLLLLSSLWQGCAAQGVRRQHSELAAAEVEPIKRNDAPHPGRRPAKPKHVPPAGACKLLRDAAAAAKTDPTQAAEIPVEIFTASEKQGLYILNKQPFYNADAVYIGIANNPNLDGYHHYYLISGKTRFDGAWGGEVRINQRDGAVFASHGVLFKLEVSAKDKAAIDAAIEKQRGERSVTCVHGLCKLLDDAGVMVTYGGGSENKRYAAAISAGLLKGDAHSKNGKAIPTSVYASSAEELIFFLKTAAKVDKESKEILINQGAVLELTDASGQEQETITYDLIIAADADGQPFYMIVGP